MQRPSLLNLQIHNGTGESGLATAAEDASVAVSHTTGTSSSSPDSPIANGANGSAYFFTSADSEDMEMNKHEKRNRSVLIAMYHSRPDRFIHAIPVLIFLCVFALYICSHEPSPKDLVHIKGFRLPSELVDLTDIDYFERYTVKVSMDSFPTYRRFHRKLSHIQV